MRPGEPAMTFFVSPNGDDSNPGTEAAPFQSLERARDHVRSFNREMSGDIVVVLRGGTYVVRETIRFDHRDSGFNGFDVVYRTHPGETPEISGGFKVTEWEPADEGPVEGMWRTSLPGIENTRQFYINGRRATRTRGQERQSKGWDLLDDPELEFWNLVETYTGYEGPLVAQKDFPSAIPIYSSYKGRGRYAEMARWRHPENLEFIYDVGWTHSVIPVDSIVELDDGVIITMRWPAFRDAQMKGGVRIGTPNTVENALELLSDPGSWYFDREEAKLYYLSLPGENMQSADAAVPAVETLIEVKGTLSHPVQHLAFEGITFKHTTWLKPSRIGHVDVQANLSKDPEDDDSIGSFVKPVAGVMLEAAHSVRMMRCRFSKMGSTGIDIGEGCRRLSIVGCDLHDLSGSGIQVGGFQISDAHPSDPRAVVKEIEIANNYLHGIGEEYRGSVGILAGYVQKTTIAHNEICYAPYSGISVGWGWGYLDQGSDSRKPESLPRFDGPTVSRENIIAYNHVHHVMQLLHDGGGIYVLSMQPRSRIVGNWIHNNGRGDQGMPGGIYLDEGSGGFEVAENIVHDVLSAFHYNDNQKIPGRKESNHLHRNHFDMVPDDPGFPRAAADRAGLEPSYRDLLKT